MSVSVYDDMDSRDNLKRYIQLSLAAHFIIFIGIFSMKSLYPVFKIDNKLKINVLQSTVKVDVVGMPKNTLKELRQLSQNTGAWNKKKMFEVKKSANTNKIEYLKPKERKNFMSMLQQLSSKKDEKSKMDKKNKPTKKNRFDRNMKSKLRKLVLSGNKVSKGNSLVGINSQEVMDSFNKYVMALPDIIKRHWKLPQFLLEQTLQCRIQLFLTRGGQILKVEIFESSGNSEYDHFALSSIKKSAPFPEVDDSILHRISRGDIILGFPL